MAKSAKAGKYAVIRLGGRQFKVIEGEELLIDKLTDLKATPEVLLVAEGDPTSPSGLRGASKVLVGKPVVKGAKVTFKVVTEVEKGAKVEVYHFKAKSRYKKHTGFRPKHTRILVEKISI